MGDVPGVSVGPEGAGGHLPGQEVPVWQNRLEGDAGRRQPEPEDECQYHGASDGQNKVRREDGGGSLWLFQGHAVCRGGRPNQDVHRDTVKQQHIE